MGFEARRGLVVLCAAALACAPPVPVEMGPLEGVATTPVTLGRETRPALPVGPGARWRIELTLPEGHLVLAAGGRGARGPAAATFVSSTGDRWELLREPEATEDPVTGWDEWVVPVPSELAGREGSLLLEIEPAEGAEEGAVFALPVVVPVEAGTGTNVILVSIDTLRSDRLGCYGNPRETSPAVDRLAREGVRFRRVVAPSNWTLPSHYSMLTSLYPTAHGVNPDRAVFGGLRSPTTAVAVRGSRRESTLAERMAALGYLTAAVTENGWVDPGFGFDQGFASYVADPAGTLESTRLQVVRWLREHHELPFFLFVHTYQPHQPYDPPPPYDAMFVEPGHVGYALPGLTVPVEILEDFQKDFFSPTEADEKAFRGLYDGEVRYVDEFVADLRVALNELGLEGRTVVVFTSDHGEEIFEHGRFTHGDALYDEVMRVPLIFWGPGRLEGGLEIDQTVTLLDILPTVVELAGGTVEGPVQGRSLLPVLSRRDGTVAPRDLFAEGVRKDSAPLYCVWRGAEKYILDGTTEELYDLSRDPGETRNLAAANPGRAAELRSAIEAWVEDNRRVGEAFAGGETTVDPEVLERLRALGYVE